MKGTIDEVIIKVDSKVGPNTGENINSLAKSLENLKASIKGGYDNLSKLADNLNALKESSKGLDELISKTKNLSTLATNLAPLSTITSPKGLTKTIKDLGLLPNVMAKITPDTLQNVARVSEQLATALTPLANKFADIAVGFSSLQALANKYGVSVTKITEGTSKTINVMSSLKKGINSVKNVFTKLKSSFDNFRKTSTRGFDKLVSKTKQLGLSLLGTRSIFTATRKAISEYMQLDEELTKQTTNLWRALGAQLAPAVEEVLYLFKQFTRVVYSFVYAITGVDLIARANAKAMKTWGNAAKSTLGNLQKFDDLNVADFGKGSGDNSLIELDKIDLSPIQWIIDATIRIKNAFKEAFNTGQWKGVGKEIANLFNDAFSRIKVTNFKKIFTKITKPLSTALNATIANLNWSDIAKGINNIFVSIHDTINEFIDDIDFKKITQGAIDFLLNFNISEVVNRWSDSFRIGLSKLSDISITFNANFDEILTEANKIGTSLGNMFNTISDADWENITKGIVNLVNTGLEILVSIIETTDWSSMGTTLGTIINTIFETFDFEKLANGLSSLAHGLLTGLTTAIETINWKEVGSKIIKLIISVDWGTLVVDLLDFCTKLWNGILDAAKGVGASLSEWLSKLFHGKEDQDARSFGKKIGDGIQMGNAKALMETNSLSKALQFIAGFILGFFGIHSPSTWARDKLGKNIVEGFADGLSGMWDRVKGFFKDVVNGVIGLINDMINKINNKLRISVSSTMSSVLKALGVNVYGGYYQLFSIPTIPKLDIGTNEVPYEGLYHLHEGEAVVPKKYNPAVGGGYSGELDEKIDRLISIVENMDTQTIVNVGNKTLYEEQKKYNNFQRNKYGTINV